MFLDLSILNADLDNIESFLKPVIGINAVLHMDIMDGVFVKQTSFDETIVKRSKDASPTSVIDVHLMCVNPEKLFVKYKEAGADYITFHYETSNIKENIDRIHELGLKAGLSINPDTDVEVLVPYLKDVDMVLVMSVYPGLGGQSFMPNSIEKVKFLREYKEKNDLHYLINIDGGINMNTYQFIKPYCDLAVVGSAITKSNEYVKTFYDYLIAFNKENWIWKNHFY